MLTQAQWSPVEHAMNNFAVMMGGVMMIAASRAAAGRDPAAPVQDAGPSIRTLINERLGKPQLDHAAFERIRSLLQPDDAAELTAACAEFAGDLTPLTSPLDADQMLAYIHRGGPGDPAFDLFMQRFMPIAQRIQAIVQSAPPRTA